MCATWNSASPRFDRFEHRPVKTWDEEKRGVELLADRLGEQPQVGLEEVDPETAAWFEMANDGPDGRFHRRRLDRSHHSGHAKVRMGLHHLDRDAGQNFAAPAGDGANIEVEPKADSS